MGKISTINRISREDIPDAPDWILQILQPLNQFISETNIALTKNVDFVENIPAIKFPFSVATGDTYPTSFPSFTIKNTLRTKPVGVLLLSLSEVDATVLTNVTANTVRWSYKNSKEGSFVSIDWITGLVASKKYSGVLLII